MSAGLEVCSALFRTVVSSHFQIDIKDPTNLYSAFFSYFHTNNDEKFQVRSDTKYGTGNLRQVWTVN